MKTIIIDGDALKTWVGSGGYTMFGRDQYLHRYIAEKALGRNLKSNEVVHHIDYNKANNSPDNLLVCSQAYHTLIHTRTDLMNKGCNPDTAFICSSCKSIKALSEFSKSKRRWNGHHHTCKSCVSLYKQQKGYNRNKFTWRARLAQQYRRCETGYRKNVEISWLESCTIDTTKEGKKA